MRRFFPKDTVEAAVWCNQCHRESIWRISGGRPMYCIPCYARRQAAREAAQPKTPADTQMNLFQPKEFPCERPK